MLDGNNLVKAHDCYMQLELGINMIATTFAYEGLYYD